MRRPIVWGIVIVLVICLCTQVAAGGFYALNQESVNAAVAQAMGQPATPTPTPTRVPGLPPTNTPPAGATATRTATPASATAVPGGPTGTVAPGSPTAATGTATPVRTGTAAAPTAARTLEQWASGARASSQYSSPDFAATQATGAPNTLRCADLPTAWASSKASPTEWLEVTFQTPVIPTALVIYESYNPGNVVKVELRQVDGAYRTVFEGKDPTTACPGQFRPVFQPGTALVNAVKITVRDPANDWAEIDAVQLIGRLP